MIDAYALDTEEANRIAYWEIIEEDYSEILEEPTEDDEKEFLEW